MQIFLLGTGAAEGVPALFCDCQICEEARKRGGKDLRTRCSLLVDGTVKIDLPPDTLAHVHLYRDRSFAKLEHLLFTHSHDDHFAVRELQYLSPNFAPCRTIPLNVWGTSELVRKMFPEMEGFFERAPLRFHTLLPFDTVSVAHLSVTPTVANHKKDELCLNYLLEHEGRTLLYGCDTGWYDPQTWDFLAKQRIDAVIMECGKGASDSNYEGHLSVDELIDVRRRLIRDGTLSETAPFYATHVCHTGMLLHDEMTRVLAPHGIQVAYDGFEFTV